MKLVFTREEVATALGQSAADFDMLRPILEAEGFPKPIRGLSLCWSIMDVISWVNRSRNPDSNLAEYHAANPAISAEKPSRH